MTHPDPRLLDRATLARIRSDDANLVESPIMGTRGQPGDYIAEDRRALLAHLDAITEAVEAALTSEDEIAHGEAIRGGNTLDPRSRDPMGRCAYCDGAWPCRTQRGIDRLLEHLFAEKP